MLGFIKSKLTAKKPHDRNIYGAPARITDRINISQIYLSDSSDHEFSPFIKHAISTIDHAFPNADHVIYNKETLRQFISDNYDGDVLWAYDKLRPYSYKADLGRYCLLNKLGGWYFDISIRIENPVMLAEHIQLLAFRDILKHSRTSWATSNAILYSQPDNAALKTAIDYVVRNCREEYYGLTPLCPTGPVVFGAALAAQRAQASFVYGDALELTPNHEQKNKAFVLPDGTILAWSKPSEGGDLEELGARGVNNYNELWRAGNVYN